MAHTEPTVKSFAVPSVEEKESKTAIRSAHNDIALADNTVEWTTRQRYWRTFQRYVWDDPDKTKEEKRFLLKLDFFLLTYACLAYFSKSLDQANIANAYVSGMKEALKMEGSELTYAGNIFTAGYVLGQIPAVILVTKIRPSYLISTLEILWSIFTFCAAAVTTVPQLYAIRFLVGLSEGAFFPVIIHLVSSWYTRRERAKRVTLFYCTATASGMFSGFLQSAAYTHLGGKMGHSGWEWLFIICGVISLPIGILGFFFNPDFPETTRAFYLSSSEIAFARRRLVDAGYTPLGASAWDRTKIFRIMRHWQFWVLPFGYFALQAAFPLQQPNYALWLKAEKKYTVSQINVYPTGQNAIGVVVQIVLGMLSDSPLGKGRVWQALMFMQMVTFSGVVILAIWNVPERLHMAAYYLSYFSAGAPGIWFAWYPELIPDDHEMRGFVVAVSNICSFVNGIWYSDAVWRTANAPRFHSGFVAAAVFGLTIMGLISVVRRLEVRDKRKRAGRVGEMTTVTELGGS